LPSKIYQNIINGGVSLQEQSLRKYLPSSQELLESSIAVTI